MMDVVYYTCLNNDCEKHRSIFVEGDPAHATCARERLYLEGQRSSGVPGWLWFALPAAVAAAAGAYLLLMRMRAAGSERPALREEAKTQTWSGSHAHADERRGHPVPPPIGGA